MNVASREEWKRLLAADLCELARGRVRPYRHWRQIVFEADLSPEARECIATVVGRSRLWRLERGDVAEELVSHFAEGREAGRTDAELLQSFGNPRQAARLIRHTKKRQRPVLYRAFVATLKTVGLIAAVYAVLVLWTNVSSPRVTVDYRAKLNALEGTAPGEDTAWPYYRKALLAMDVDNPGRHNHPDRDLLSARPGDTNWSEAMAWRDRNVEAIEWIRQGGQRPSLGFSAGRYDELSSEDWRAFFPEQDDPNPSPRKNPPDNMEGALTMELLFFAGKAKTLGNVLELDIRTRVARRETKGLVENYAAGVSLAEGLLERPFWIHGSVSLAILHTMENTVVEAMETTDFAFERSELAALRREVGSADSVFRALERVLEVERWMVLDVIQRTYSPGFLGSGRLTRAGATVMPKLGLVGPWNGYEDSWISTSLNDRALVSVTLPALRVLTPSRADLETRLDAGFAEMACLAEAPMGEVVSESEAMRQRVQSLDPVRYGMLIEPIDRMLSYAARESQSRARHEAFRVRLALEAHALDKGAFPPDLESLIPDYLQALPRDPITGEGLLYELSNGRPLLYSRGWDRDDDGGRDEQGAGHSGKSFYQTRPDGDWVFFH